MKLVTLNLKAGIPQDIGRGRFIRILEALHPLNIETVGINSGANQTGLLLSNTGAEFDLFKSAFVTSGQDQTVKIMFSELNIFDNRLGVNDAVVLETVERAAVDYSINTYSADASGIEILSGAVTSRRVAVISTDGPVRISKTQGGPSFTVDGVLTHPASGALWASADSAVNVEVLEYLN